jgi:N-acetyl-anhydromuramyl-L-alanine amidase AmpD
VSDDHYFKMLDAALGHVSKWADRADRLAYMLYRVMDGDTIDDVYETLHKYGYVDENHEWIHDEDEDEDEE